MFAFVPSLRGPEEAGASLTRTGSRATGAGRRIQRALIVAQVAATVAVLTAAGLLARTLLRLYEVDPGVRLENTLTMEVPLEGERTPAQSLALQEEMQRRIAALPGVTEVGIGWNVPLRASGVQLELKAEGRAEEPGGPRPVAEYRTATPEYFRAAGIPLIRGREFAATDGATPAGRHSQPDARAAALSRPGPDRPAGGVDRRRAPVHSALRRLADRGRRRG